MFQHNKHTPDPKLYGRDWVFPRHGRTMTFYLAAAACLVAVSVVLTRFFAILLFGNSVRVSFGTLPITLAGFLLGPVFGGLTGLCADLLGQMINPQGAPHYGIMMNQILFGVIPGLYVFVFKRISRGVVVASVLTSTLLLSALLQTRWSMDFTGLPFSTQFIQRIPGILVNGISLLVLCLLLHQALVRLQVIVRRNQRPALKRSGSGPDESAR